MYEESGHELRLSGRSYRCDKDCNRKCNVAGEKQLNKETFERKVSRLGEKFQITPDEGILLFNKIMRENLCDIILGTAEEVERKHEQVFLTRRTLLQDAEAGKIEASDVEYIDESLVQAEKAEYPLMLMGIALSFLKACANPEQEAAFGQNLSYLAKHICLSNEGKIVGIELEKWGWYLINYVDRNLKYRAPSYLAKLKEGKVNIVNKHDEILDLSFQEAAMSFGGGNSKEALGQDMTLMYESLKLMREVMGNAFSNDPRATPAIYEALLTNPAFMVVMKAVASLGLKPVGSAE